MLFRAGGPVIWMLDNLPPGHLSPVTYLPVDNSSHDISFVYILQLFPTYEIFTWKKFGPVNASVPIVKRPWDEQ